VSNAERTVVIETREDNLKIFITGTNVYIGGSVASALIADGHKVRGPFAATKG
jgi:hypothetical protein